MNSLSLRSFACLGLLAACSDPGGSGTVASGGKESGSTLNAAGGRAAGGASAGGAASGGASAGSVTTGGSNSGGSSGTNSSGGIASGGSAASGGSSGGTTNSLGGNSAGGASSASGGSQLGGATGALGGRASGGGTNAGGANGGVANGGAATGGKTSGGAGGVAGAGSGTNCDILKQGAKGDGNTLNTKAIQATIDQCAASGGGTIVIPKGTFLTGSLFVKPLVNIQLVDGATLLGSKNIDDFPVVLTRFEGHFANWRAALLNAEKTNGFHLSGPGTLDGNGAAFWSLNSPTGRPRLVFIRDSTDVVVSGVKFKNSASWNLHLYNCQHALVEDSRFEIDAGASGPSTDGTDIDSSQDVTVRGCYYSVNDDCVVLKGNRYDGLNQTPTSLPVSNVHVTNCTFVRGKGALSIGTEATYVHDVEFDNSSVSGDFPTLRLKMRPDTAGQRYEKINVHDINLNGTDDIVGWELTHGTTISGTAPPAVIRDVTLSNFTGKTAAFGNIAANATTTVSTIAFKNFNVTLTTPTLTATGATGLTMDNVVINGKLWSATANKGQPGPVN